jgi:hypothetical protein
VNATILAAQEACRKIGTVFERDLAQYLDHGYVSSGPRGLVLFRAAHTDRPDLWVEERGANAWFVHLAIGVGGLSWIFRQMPYTLPFLIWCRGCRGDFRPRIYSTRNFGKLV